MVLAILLLFLLLFLFYFYFLFLFFYFIKYFLTYFIKSLYISLIYIYKNLYYLDTPQNTPPGRGGGLKPGTRKTRIPGQTLVIRVLENPPRNRIYH